METYFSRINGAWPNWQVWGLLAGQFDDPGTIGIMFDAGAVYGGAGEPPDRQGFALFRNHPVFNDLPANGVPANDAEAEAMRHYLYTWIHEAGHAFNFLHSWNKGRPDSLSWMNYDWRYDYRNGSGSLDPEKRVMILAHEADPERALRLTEPARALYRADQTRALNLPYHQMARHRAECLKKIGQTEQARQEIATLRQDLAQRDGLPAAGGIERPPFWYYAATVSPIVRKTRLFSALASTSTVSPSLISPARSFCASVSCTIRWIARLSGRAPKVGS